jgi:hypothetical protein
MAFGPQPAHGTFELFGVMGTGIEELLGDGHQSGQWAISCTMCIAYNGTKTNQRMAAARLKWTQTLSTGLCSLS